MSFISVYDILLPPLYLLAIFIISGYIKGRYIRQYPHYKYYRKAVFIKIFGGLAFGMIYLYYYGGGDTTNYFETSMAYGNLAVKDFRGFMDYFNSEFSESQILSYFDPETGYPVYKLTDKPATFTSLFYMPVSFLGFHSFFCTTILSAVISFSGLWRLYLTFTESFPNLKKELFISIFCIPSVFFWGSGIMKDSIIISAIGWYVYSFHSFFIKKQYVPRYAIYLFISAYLMMSVKPYVMFAMLPGSIIWLSDQYSKRFSSKTLRRVFTPVLLVLGGFIAFFVLRQLDDALGLYRLDNVVERASIVNKDLKMDYYGGKTFDIGDYEPTLPGVMSVAHKAIFAALFRPTIMDAQSFVMMLAGVENTYILLLTIVLLIRLRVLRFFIYIRSNPLLLFSVLFSVFFAFSVGLSISNFGSLVRLRIPALPFFLSSMFVIRYYYNLHSGKKIRI